MSISQDWITNELEDTELEALHRSPSVEYSFYNAVRAGDMEAVNKNCEEDSFLHLKGTGILSKNPLTNLKYHFVVTTAMITRYCIDGGLEPEQAYRLSDFYILKMDSCTTVPPDCRSASYYGQRFYRKNDPPEKKFYSFQTGHAMRGLYLRSH